MDVSEGRELFKPRGNRNNAATAFDPSAPIITAPNAADRANLPQAAVDIFGNRASSPTGQDAINTTTAADPKLTAAAAANQGWTIVLAAFRGQAADQNASQMLTALHALPDLKDAFVERRGQGTIVGLGRFPLPSGEDAKSAIARVHAITLDNRQPFLTAFLAPPDSTVVAGSRPEHNLLSARAQYGKLAQSTLQVAVYGPPDLRKPPTADELVQIRKDAEDAVAKLRAEGELAYYFHSTEKSLVTIGLFRDNLPGQSDPADLVALKQRFPHNLYNGGAIKMRTNGREIIQPSVVVRIPSN